MKVGDLVKLTNVGAGSLANMRGIVFDVDVKPPTKMASVLWTDGDRTKEFPKDLEVVCR